MPDAAGSVAQNRGRRSVQRKLYNEEDDEDDKEEDRGKMVQAGNRFHATQAGN